MEEKKVEKRRKNKKRKEKNSRGMLTVAVAATASNTRANPGACWNVIIAFSFSDRQGELLKWKNK